MARNPGADVGWFQSFRDLPLMPHARLLTPVIAEKLISRLARAGLFLAEPDKGARFSEVWLKGIVPPPEPFMPPGSSGFSRTGPGSGSTTGTPCDGCRISMLAPSSSATPAPRHVAITPMRHIEGSIPGSRRSGR